MKLSDALWMFILVSFNLFVVLPISASHFIRWTTDWPYVMGFIKTALLATMGETLVHRFKHSTYLKPGLILRIIIWGLLGVVFVLIFKVFATGVVMAQEAHLLPSLPGLLGVFLFAGMTSVLMNLFFAPAFMLFHRVTDAYIDLSQGSVANLKHVTLDSVIMSIDFKHYIHFVLLKTIPFFWIPAHTVTFMLPEVYRVLMAGYLSIALGILLSLSKSKKID